MVLNNQTDVAVVKPAFIDYLAFHVLCLKQIPEYHGMIRNGLYGFRKMIAAVDVCYTKKDIAIAAAVVFKNFADKRPVATYSTRVNQFGEYIPGQFYKRELPCLMAVLTKVNEKLDTVIIDGYVMLGDKPGLGYYLWGKLAEKVAVIGVAKTVFKDAYSVKIFRGKSNKPLYITSIGIDPVSAAENISKMHGSYRIPKLLKQVDNLAKERIKKYIPNVFDSIDLGEQ